MQPISAWVFDFDGTIIDTERALLDAYVAIHERHGITCDRARLRKAAGSEFDFDPWGRFGANIPRPELDRLLVVQAEERYRRLPVMPGAREFISALLAEGAVLGIASNGCREHVERHLRRAGLLEKFTVIACRDDVSAPKPAPDLYQLAMARLGLAPGAGIAIEDSMTGVQAAKSAGLWAVAVPNETTSRQDFAKADLVVPSLANQTPAGVISVLAQRMWL